MKRLALMGAVASMVLLAQDEVLHISLAELHHDKACVEAATLFIGIIADTGKDVELDKAVAEVKKDLEFSGQLSITIEYVAPPKTTQEIKVLLDRGFSLLLFLSHDRDDRSFSWRLYDATDSSMVKGKKVHVVGDTTKEWAHTIADSVWPEIMGTASSFSSKIAYVKKIKKSRTQYTCQLYVADYDGSSRRMLVERPTIIVSPTWNNESDAPALLYSEFCPTNVRIMATNLCGKTRLVFDAPGTTAGISYANQSNDVIYCRSGEIWLHAFDPTTSKGIHKKIISRDEPCSSPCLYSNGDVVYSSAGSLFLYDHDSKLSKKLSSQGYCVSPSVYEASNKIVYTKKQGASMQVFLYDRTTQQHQQLTFDKADKADPCWSGCGNWVAYSVITKDHAVWVTHVLTGVTRCITPSDEHCGYPAWSKF